MRGKMNKEEGRRVVDKKIKQYTASVTFTGPLTSLVDDRLNSAENDFNFSLK